MRAQLYTITGQVLNVDPKNGTNFELEEIQELVGGNIELVLCREGLEMYINEEGKLLGLPVNPKATSLSGLYPHDVICGPAVVGVPALFRSPSGE